MSGEGLLNPEALYQNKCVLELPLNYKDGSIVPDLAPMHGKTITANGDAKQIFSPLVDSLGIANLNGSTDYISLPDSFYTFGTNNFTAEIIINPRSSSSGGHIFSLGENSGYFAGIRLNQVNIDSTHYKLELIISSNGSAWILDYIDTLSLSINTCYHIAITRNGNYLSLFINGNLRYTYSIGSNPLYSGPKYTIGVLYYVPSTHYFNGFVKEFRFSNIARYSTTGFVPQTTKFTNDANTLLLLHFDNNGQTFTDSSSYNRTITAYGSVHQVMPPVGKGLAYLDGTGDYLTVPASSDFANGIMQINMRVFFTALPASGTKSFLYNIRTDGNNASELTLYNNSGTYQLYFLRLTTTEVISLIYVWTPTLYHWYNFSVSADGTTANLMIDNVIVATQSASYYLNVISNQPLSIGKWSGGASNYFSGYLDEYCIRKGNILSTIPNTIIVPDPHTKLLLHCDNTAAPSVFKDSSRSVGLNNATVNGTCSIVDNTMNFNGSTDYLTIVNSIDLQFGSGEFTIFLWFKCSGTISTTQYLIDLAYTNSSAYASILVGIIGSKLASYFSTSGSAWVNSAAYAWTTTLVSGTRYCLTLIRKSNGYIYGYLNNIQDFSYNIGSNALSTNTGKMYIGAYNNAGTVANYFTGYMKDCYIFKQALSQDQIGFMMEKESIN